MAKGTIYLSGSTGRLGKALSKAIQGQGGSFLPVSFRADSNSPSYSIEPESSLFIAGALVPKSGDDRNLSHSYLRSNLGSTFRALRFSKLHGISVIVFMSTASAFWSRSREADIRLRFAQPHLAYKWSKVLAELIFYAYGALTRTQIFRIRLSRLEGDGCGLLDKLSESSLNKSLHWSASLASELNFLCIDQAANDIVHIYKSHVGGSYYISGESVEALSLLRALSVGGLRTFSIPLERAKKLPLKEAWIDSRSCGCERARVAIVDLVARAQLGNHEGSL